MVTYSARVLDLVHYRPGTWHGLRVAVFRREGEAETQVGEYTRNYPSLFRTFAPFRAGERDYALYSPHYTGTRIMELPSCRDIGGEEPADGGFCPVDFLVPTYVDIEWTVDGRNPRRFRKQMPNADDLAPREVTRAGPPGADGSATTQVYRNTPLGPLTYHPFGFVAGCVWGDDSSWKLQYLDLSRAAEGILARDDRFGYIALPDALTLEQAVDMVDYQCDLDDEDYSNRVGITIVQRFDLRDGRRIAE